MSSERSGKFAKTALALAMGVLASGVAVMACVSIDNYGPPVRVDAGSVPEASSDVTLPDASVEECSSCLAAQCPSQWEACQGEPDCLTCLTDPLGERCTQSLKRHDVRNCGCVKPTCVGKCGTLCYKVPPVVDPTMPSRVSGECIACATGKCSQYIGACVSDPVCFNCTTDSSSPKCAENATWHAATDCLCATPNNCFEECCMPEPP